MRACYHPLMLPLYNAATPTATPSCCHLTQYSKFSPCAMYPFQLIHETLDYPDYANCLQNCTKSTELQDGFMIGKILGK